MNLDAVVVSNIKYFLQQRGMKMGEFERLLHLGVGYFSRHVNNKDGSISLVLAQRIANEFGITIDELCSDIRFKELERTAAEYGFRLTPLEPINIENKENW